jgi:hypothetical protein
MGKLDFLMQYRIERIVKRTVTWTRVAILLLVLGALIGYRAYGAEPTIQDMSPPRAFFAVMQCDELVSGWVVMQDGHVYRTDAEHHPDTAAEYMAFLAWAQKALDLDVYTLPCSDKTAGGKVRTKSPT